MITSTEPATITARIWPSIIDGREVTGAGDEVRRDSPAHDTLVARYHGASEADVDAAVRAALRAFSTGGWPRTSGAERASLLRRVAGRIEAERDDLALIETLESGKPISQAKDEISSAAGIWYYAASLAQHAYGDAHNALGPEYLAVTVKEPAGVVGMITPWNFPLLIVSQKLPFALAVGCTAVIKPSNLTPGTTVLLGALCQEAGMPDGGVNMISFTGSTAVGTQVAATAASQLKRVELELGGKNPQIVFPDADLDAALDAVVFGVYFNQGECCNSGSRLLVHKDIAEEFTEAVTRRAKDVAVGDPLDEHTKVGAIISDAQLSTIERYVAEGVGAGAELRVGG